MQRIGEDGVRERYQKTEDDQTDGRPLLRKHEAKAGDRQRRPGKLPLPLEAIGDLRGDERSAWRGHSDDRGVGERLGEIDTLRGEQGRDPAGEAVIADGL